MVGVAHMVEAHSRVKTQQKWIEVVAYMARYIAKNLVGAGGGRISG